jgi:hypothetical protein
MDLRRVPGNRQDLIPASIFYGSTSAKAQIRSRLFFGALKRSFPRINAGAPTGLRSVSLVGALCFSRGKQRFSVAGKSSKMITRFSAGNARG